VRRPHPKFHPICGKTKSEPRAEWPVDSNRRSPLLYAFAVNASDISALIASVQASGRTALTEIESKRLLAAAGLPASVPETAIDAASAVRVANGIGYPVVLKVISPQISHKSEIGGVELNLADDDAVRAALERIRLSLLKCAPAAQFEGVTIDAMARPGVELIAGVMRDESFGPAVLIGLGGIFTEVIRDTAIRLAPIGRAEAAEMIAELRGEAVLRGMRGQPGINKEMVASVLAEVSELASAHPEIAEMDLNPIIAYPDKVAILDARIVVRTPSAGDDSDPHRAMRLANLRRAFDPRAVAVIGDKRAGGYLWLRAMRELKVKVYSIQIDPNEIPGIEAMGVENRKSLAEIDGPIDYAVSAVPRNVAPRILKDCTANRVGAISFFTSGFSETAEEEGIRLEEALRQVALDSEIALVGPNCMGLYNPAAGLCNYPGEATGEAGNVCFISQSGTHTVNFCLQAPVRGIKVNKAASIGNATVVEAADYIDLMADDPATAAIGMYIEGVRHGRHFFESVQRAAGRHPVVIWKGGATEAGARAALSHTGAMTSRAAVWQAMVRQAGAVEVDGFDAMLDAMELFSRGRRHSGRKMGLVAMTGGQSVAITDAFSTAGLEVPALSPRSYEELKQFFNIIGGSCRNPLDAGGTIGFVSDGGNLDRILGILERDPVIDGMIVELGSGLRAGLWAAQEAALSGLLDQLAAFNSRSQKPFATVIQPAHLEAVVARAREQARARGLVVFESFERAGRAFKVAAEYWEHRAR